MKYKRKQRQNINYLINKCLKQIILERDILFICPSCHKEQKRYKTVKRSEYPSLVTFITELFIN